MVNKNAAIIGGVVAVALLLITIIIAVSFQDVNYYEMGFKKRKSTGSVDTSKVYTTGRYAVGPDSTFKTFSSIAHTVELKSIKVFASDRLQVSLSATFQYFLRSESLKLLHDEYDIYYKNIMITAAQDALKGAAISFTTEQYITSRALIEDTMFIAVRERLGGKCCPKDCASTSVGCPTGCIPYASCTTSDKGFFVEVRYFQFLGIGIPGVIADQKLRALTRKEEAEKEQFNQEATVVRKKTTQEVLKIGNEASVVSQNATAYATLLKARARANSTAMVEGARAEGLRLLYTALGLTNQSHRASFDYLRTLSDMENARFAVDFNQLIMLLGANSFSLS